MIPPDISSTPSTLQDPVNALPTELNLRFLKCLSSTKILQITSTSSKWKNFILSNPILFNVLDVCEPFFDPDEAETHEEQKVAANKLINKVLRWANLAENRLVYAGLEISSFVHDYHSSLHDFKATRISIVIDILRFSSRFLKTLDLLLIDFGTDVAIKTNHITNIIQSLDGFQVLQKVVIGSDLGLTLESGSEASRFLRISEPNHHYNEEISEIHRNRSTYLPLIQVITNFTGSGIGSADLRGSPVMSFKAFEEFKLSSTFLRTLDICMRGIQATPGQVIAFIVACPNMVYLSVSSDQSRGFRFNNRNGDGEAEVLEFRIPKVASSKLKYLRIEFPGIDDKLILDENFFNWAGEMELSKAFTFGDVKKCGGLFQ